jgi:methyl-accepting chemotaxis protein
MDMSGVIGGLNLRPKGAPMSEESLTHAEDPYPRFRRRHFLVDKKSQLIPTLKVASIVTVLLVLINLVINWQIRLTTNDIVASNPQLRAQMEASDTRFAMFLAALSLICIGLVVIRSILLTHRTAGAAYKVGLCLNQIGEGRFDTKLYLRLKDNLRSLEEPFNNMAASLRQAAKEDADALTKIADAIKGQENASIVTKLRELADAKNRVAG